MSIRILIVEDEMIVATDLAQKLSQLGYSVAGTATNGHEAVQLACQTRPDLVLMDILLDGTTDGIEAAEAIRRQCDLPVIFLTAHSDPLTLDRAKSADAYAYVLKPFDERELYTAIEIALSKHGAERRLRESEAHFKLLSETAERLLRSEDPQNVVEDLCAKVLEHLRCDCFCNFLVDEVQGRLRLNACAGIPAAEARRIEWLDFGQAICGCVAQSGQRMVFEDVSRSTDPRLAAVSSWGIQTYACHPLLAQGRVLGTLAFGARNRPAFAPEELALMKSVADQVAVGMQRLRAEQVLRDREEQLRLVLEAARVGWWDWDLRRDVVTADQRTIDLVGTPADARPSFSRFLQCVAPEDAAGLRSSFAQNLAAPGDYHSEFRVVHADGSRHWVMTRSRSYFEGERPSRLMGVIIDITERKQFEEQLRRAKEAAEAANVTKSQFLANMSHELRTPMNAIIGMTDQALEESLSPGARDCLETVKTSAESLHAILNQILDLSRIEAGKMALEVSPFHLRSLVEETLKVLRGRADQKGLRLECDIAGDVPEGIVGDSLRLRQVLINLLGNALKFTAQGCVSLRIVAAEDRRGTPDRQTAVAFSVSDTGIGIAPEHLGRIFDPFTQADASTTRRFGGTGLGLAITSNLVKLMGGELRVQSEMGRGSTFDFTVRFDVVATSAPAAGAAEDIAELPTPSRPLQILLVEDTPANQKLIRRILAKRGHSVELAENGRQAVACAQQRPYDVVLMDVQMPEMDGFEATRAIRALGGDWRRVPIIAMTAHALKGDREWCLAHGMDDYLSKPIDARQLLRRVERS